MKNIFVLLFLIFAAAAFPADYADVNSCLQKGKDLFSAGQLDAARDVFTDCVNMDKKNADALISLAGVYFAQNNLTDAKNYFEASLPLLPQDSRYNAYVYSRLGDIYFKQNDLESAKKSYRTALKFNAADSNALTGLGVIYEKEKDWQTAAQNYRAALSAEPYNTTARDNLRGLETKIFTDDEILAALKLRRALPDGAAALPPDGKELFLKIRRAEQSSGVKFLKDKYKNRPPQGLIIETGTGTPDLRFMLSLAGYKEVMRLMSIDAAKYFVSAGIKTYQVYDLRDLEGKPVFGPNKILTEPGIAVYTAALAGQKTFLLPGEPVPAVVKAENEAVKNLLAQGYVEISVKEYQYIMDKTFCSEDTLKNEAKVKILVSGGVIRRFVINPDAAKPPVAYPLPAWFPYYHAMMYRAKNAPGDDGQPVYGSFFGTGAVKADVTLCSKKTGRLQ